MIKKVILIQKYIIVASILFLAAACENGSDINPDGLNKVNLVIDAQKYAKVEIARTSGKGNTVSDDFEIKSVERVGDILKVKVSYSGGCKEHTFDVIFGGQILLTQPCQINLTLTHNAKDDPCDSLVTETLEIDLTKLIGYNENKDECIYNVFSALNASDDPDGAVTHEP